MPNDNMKVVSIMTRKGGAGKTTLTRALVSAAMAQGKRCLVFDTDPQQALSRWANKLEISDPLVEILPIDIASDLNKKTEEAYEAGDIDLVFVDTIGAAGEWADNLAEESDAIVVPMMLSDDDLEITTDTYNWYVGLRDRVDDPGALPQFHVVLSAVPTKQNISETEVEHDAISKFPVLDDYFMHRKQHKDASRQGFLHHILQQRKSSKYSLLRTHAKYYAEALEEADAILNAVLGVK